MLKIRKNILLMFALLVIVLAGFSKVSAEGNDPVEATANPVETEVPGVTAEPTISPAPVTATQPAEVGTPTPKPTPCAEYAKAALKIEIAKAQFDAKRVSKKKAKLTWKSLKGVSGYLISYSEKEKGEFQKLAYINDPNTKSYTVTGLNPKKEYYYRLSAFNAIDGYRYYSYYSATDQCRLYAAQKIYNKLIKLKKSFPQGRYWNHAGVKVSKNQSLAGFVTKKPCKHKSGGITRTSTCNYYIGRDGMKGYQCWGFASLISDKMFGKAAYKKHKSFKKAKIGDHVRYGNKHSVVVLEKHDDYIIVCEVNYGNTCMINWGRKISKDLLKDAIYYTRY